MLQLQRIEEFWPEFHVVAFAADDSTIGHIHLVNFCTGHCASDTPDLIALFAFKEAPIFVLDQAVIALELYISVCLFELHEVPMTTVDKCCLKAGVRHLVITVSHDTFWILTGRVEMSGTEVVQLRALPSTISISLLDELSVKCERTSDFVVLR